MDQLIVQLASLLVSQNAIENRKSSFVLLPFRMMLRRYCCLALLVLLAGGGGVLLLTRQIVRCTTNSPDSHHLVKRWQDYLRSQSHEDSRFRILSEVSAEFDVYLFLDLQFVGDEAASELETKDSENDVVIHFCASIQQQVRSKNSLRMAMKIDHVHITIAALVHILAAHDISPPLYFILFIRPQEVW
jgi:hypothetical protein